MDKFLIKNAKLVDGKVIDILVKDGHIENISSFIEMDENIDVIELDEDCYISAGWIDSHTHCFEKFELYADNCEEIGYRQGVTSVIDAGTAGADNIEEFFNSIKECKTHVYSLLNISKTGICAQNELADMTHIDKKAFEKMCKKFPRFILGAKVRMSQSVVGENGDLPLYEAIQMANQVNLPLMVHIGTAPAQLETVLKNVREGDIVTHIFNPKENGIVSHGKIKDCVFEAYQRGVYFDLGHGTDSFSFDVLDIANENHIQVYSISSDIYFRNRHNGPVYNLSTTMSKLLMRGYTLEEVIDSVTRKPAKMFRLDKRGRIEKGCCGDFTIFKVIHENKEVTDSTGKKVILSQYIQPVAVILRNEYIKL
jgi:probable amidohydrolase EF_0837/AHA_3915